MANFKDTVKNKTDQEIARKILEEQKGVDLANERKSIDTITEKFSDTLLVEKVIHKIKEQMSEDFRKELEDGLAIQIEEAVRVDVTESVTRQLAGQLDERVIESNKLMVDAITKLSEKLDNLNESLNIVVPAPIVHVNMPKVTRKINRNDSGLVESITEDFEDKE